MWNTVLFDLDGTLTDSGEGIMKSVQYALEKLGKPEPDLEKLRCFVGPPLKQQFMAYAGLDEEQGEQAVKYYRERYTVTGIYENSLYPGVRKMLELFRKNGIRMCVASSKPEIYVKQILEYFKIDSYFSAIVGSELDGTRTDKAEVIEETLRRLGMEKQKNEIVMVGDRKFDVIGARNLGLDCIGVTYGYGNLAEMKEARPAFIATEVAGIAECMLNQISNRKNETIPVKIWRCLYPIGIHYGIMLLISSVWSLVVIAIQMAVHGNTDAAEIMNLVLEQNNLITIVTSLVTIPLVGWLYHRDEQRRKSLGMQKRMMISEKFSVIQMIFVAVFAIGASCCLNQAISLLKLQEIFDTYAELAEYLFNPNMAVINILSIGILAPIAEEMVFRGLVYRRMRDYFSVPAAVILSAAAFGIYHGNVVQAIYAGALGILLALLYERYKTIWAPILAHMAANIFSTIGNMAGIVLEPESFTGIFVFFLIQVVTTAIFGVIIFKSKVEKR